MPDYELKLIPESLQRGQLTGTDRFREEIFLKHGIRFSNKGPGRQKRLKNESVPFSIEELPATASRIQGLFIACQLNCLTMH